ncbi:MAG: PDZ domain-containing protein [Lysobacterales bacterium]
MKFSILFLLGLCAAQLPFVSAAVDVEDTRLLKSPTISAEHVAFLYDGDVWIAPRNGGNARRLTTAEGEEINPVLSPNGQWLAFSGNYDGNTDVYVMPAVGGEVKRLTWHPGGDVVLGFTGDSTRIMFQTPRTTHTRRHRHLYTVSVDGGPVSKLPVPTGIHADLSPNGKHIAYNPHAPAFEQWKNYRGGRISRLWIMGLDDYDVVEVPKPDGGSNDVNPMWIDDVLYFNSDRNGEFNLFRYNDGGVEQLTEFADFPVLNARAGAGQIVFEHAGQLKTLNPASGTVADLTISVRADLREARPRWASGDQWVRNAHPSPDGQRVVLEYRGEIVTVPAKKGFARQLSESTGVHDRNPIWSPDGKAVAWFSDAEGEYGLNIRSLDSGAVRRVELDGAGFYFNPVWSPDNGLIAFRDNAQALHLLDVESGNVRQVAIEPVYSPVITMSFSFSPDSRWMAYTLNDAGLTQVVYLYDIENERSLRLTDGLAEVSEPVFDPNGQHLYMLASTQAGPLKDWFAQSSIDATMTHDIYVATLSGDGDNPLPPLRDEVATSNEIDDSENAESETGDDEKDAGPPKTRVDEKGLDRRIQVLPGKAATRHSLRVGKTGTVYWIETTGRTSFNAFSGAGQLKRLTLEDRETKTLVDEVSSVQLTANGEKLLYQRKGGWFITDAADKVKAGDGKLKLDDVKVRVEPKAEWAQIFDEAWRINRDYFYATNYHGADWGAVRKRYAPMIAHAATRADVMRVVRWMASELGVGHSYSGEGDSIEDPQRVSVGLLGADYEVNRNRYRFSRIYGGLNWTPDLDAPLAKPGVNVSEGDYLLAVDGVSVTADEPLFRYFEQKAKRPVTLTVADSPNGKPREVEVMPTTSESALRNRAWVEDNLRKVHEATDGRIAYVHVPNTAEAGHTYFKRYFYPQSHKAGIIVDERYNGGGLFADYYIDILRRPFAAWWAMRYGEDLASPRGAVFGPKIMIADENAGSGGDLLPWMFQKYELGPVVGTRTWGGLVGILGFPVLMDGGSITAPNLAIWDDNGWIVENVGVAPDVEIFQWPKLVNAGRDPQLEKAIELALEALEAQPPLKSKRPPFPLRGVR